MVDTLSLDCAVKRVSADLAHKAKNINKAFERLAQTDPAREFKGAVRDLMVLYAYSAPSLGRQEADLRAFLATGAQNAKCCGKRKEKLTRVSTRHRTPPAARPRRVLARALRASQQSRA